MQGESRQEAALGGREGVRRDPSMRKRFPAGLALTVMLGLSVAACGGGGGGEPTDSVKGVVSAIEAKQFDKIADYACAAKKEEIKSKFNFGEQMAGSLSGLPGVKPEDLVAAMVFKFENVTYKEASRDGDKATVAMTGTMKMSIDKQKITDILKAAGGDAAAGMINTVMSGFDSISGEGIPMDATLKVVKENGKWLLCE
jgi:hypothetical protein